MSQEPAMPERLDRLDELEGRMATAHGARRLAHRYLFRKLPFVVVVILALGGAADLPWVILVMAVVGVGLYAGASADLQSLGLKRDSVADRREHQADDAI